MVQQVVMMWEDSGGCLSEDNPSEIIGLSIRLVGVVGVLVPLEIGLIYLCEKA